MPPPRRAPAHSLSTRVRATEPPGYKARLSRSGGWKCGPVRLCTQSLTCGPSHPFPFRQIPFFCRLRYFNLRKGRAFWGLRRTAKFGSSPRLCLLDAHRPKTRWLEPASSSCAELSYSLLGGFCGAGGGVQPLLVAFGFGESKRLATPTATWPSGEREAVGVDVQV